MNETETRFDPQAIKKPDPKLFQYYILVSVLTGPMVLFALIPLWNRFSTLKYDFMDDGVSMSWGYFFRREIYLAYRRIQDIHLTQNIVERWMQLSKISIQTASGNAAAEMTIEGILQANELRDFLYSRMRGAREQANAMSSDSTGAARGLARATQVADDPGSSVASVSNRSADRRSDEALSLLAEIRDSLKSIADRR